MRFVIALLLIGCTPETPTSPDAQRGTTTGPTEFIEFTIMGSTESAVPPTVVTEPILRVL